MAVNAKMEIQTAIEKLTMQMETTAREVAEIKAAKKTNPVIAFLSKTWPMIVSVLFIVAAFTRLQDRVEANETTRNNDIIRVEKRLDKFEDKFEDIGKDIKQILQNKNNK